MSTPREFWIYPGKSVATGEETIFVTAFHAVPDLIKDYTVGIRAIEYSAFETLKAENERLTVMVNMYEKAAIPLSLLDENAKLLTAGRGLMGMLNVINQLSKLPDDKCGHQSLAALALSEHGQAFRKED